MALEVEAIESCEVKKLVEEAVVAKSAVVVAKSMPAPPITLSLASGTKPELVAVAPKITWLVVVASRTPEPLK